MVFNAKNQKSRSEISKDGLPVQIGKSSDILQFCRTLDGPHLRYGSHDLLLLHVEDDGDAGGCEVFIKKGNLLVYSDYSWPLPYPDDGYGDPNEKLKDIANLRTSSRPASAALVSCSRRTEKQKQEGFRVLPLLNADTDEATFEPEYQLVDEWGGMQFPMVSFSALAHFYGDIKNVNQVLSRAQLRLLDFTPDEFIKYTDDEKRERRKKKPNLNPPKLGFAPVDKGWHRSGFCLFFDEKQKLCLLTGQDEGSYFVVELPQKVETIDEAMDVLIPEEARVPGAVRQGEWFFVPCDKEEVPELNETVLLFDSINNCGCCGTCEAVCMPLDDAESNRHTVQTVDGRVGKDGYLYLLSPTVTHDEHESVNMPDDQWCFVVKNTALRSYSEGGVD